MGSVDRSKMYVITCLVAVVMIALLSVLQGILEAGDIQMVVRRLSDACFITGVLFAGLGLLIYAFNEGLFNGIAFGFKTLARTFTAHKDEKIREEGFFEYNERLQKKKTFFLHLIIVGVSVIVISVILAVVHEMV